MTNTIGHHTMSNSTRALLTAAFVAGGFYGGMDKEKQARADPAKRMLIATSVGMNSLLRSAKSLGNVGMLASSPTILGAIVGSSVMICGSFYVGSQFGKIVTIAMELQ